VYQGAFLRPPSELRASAARTEEGVVNAVGKWVAGILAAVITAVLSAVLIHRFTAPDEPETPPVASSSASDSASAPSPKLGGPAKIYLNRDSGPAGTHLRVSGQGFDSGEEVVIRFHTETVAHTAADEQGGFADVSVRVPTDWKFTGQFGFVATGESSIKSATREFRVT
jgi:hypothetical protein